MIHWVMQVSIDLTKVVVLWSDRNYDVLLPRDSRLLGNWRPLARRIGDKTRWGRDQQRVWLPLSWTVVHHGRILVLIAHHLHYLNFSFCAGIDVPCRVWSVSHVDIDALSVFAPARAAHLCAQLVTKETDNAQASESEKNEQEATNWVNKTRFMPSAISFQSP